MYETQEQKQKIILVGVADDQNPFPEESLEELGELVDTAGGEVVGTMIQHLDHKNNATYIGSGKLKQLRELIDACEADAIVCDDELSPSQYKNLEDELGIAVMDRTLIILDIFAGRANTAEGKLQVELAQLKYRQNRLIGMRNLSRQGGGIGTRGPGEKKLEVDRRGIRNRISILKSQIEDMEAHRQITRAKRMDNSIPVLSIVGYTNAGKSTLLNTLTKANVLEEDKLFATLDPTTRSYKTESGQEVLITDTVGFIRKLPHHLIDAFRSTLEEAKYADIIIHVVDASSPAAVRNMDAVYETLKQLNVGDKPVITIFNKTDLIEETRKVFEGKESTQKAMPEYLTDKKADFTVYASVKKQIGLDEIDDVIEKAVLGLMVRIDKLFDYSKAGDIARIRKFGKIISEEYREDGIMVSATVPKSMADI